MSRLSALVHKTLPILLSGALLSSPTVHAATDTKRLLRDTTSQVILPFYQALHDASVALQARAEQFCQQPTQAGFDAVRAQWRHAMSRWMRAQSIKFGPIERDNRAWYIQFWPDDKNLVQRKTRQLLQRQEPITAARLADASVVVQGLSALEYQLFDPRAGVLSAYREGPRAARRCELLNATAQRVQQVSGALLREWHDEQPSYAARLIGAGQDTTLFRSQEEALATLIRSMVAQLEVIKNGKLAAPLGLKSGGHINPYRAESWRSRNSVANLRHNLAALQALYSARDGYGLDDLLQADPRHQALGAKIERLFDNAARQLDAIEGTLFHVADDPRSREQLLALHDTLGTLERALKRELPKALGIFMGFNSNDGD